VTAATLFDQEVEEGHFGQVEEVFWQLSAWADLCRWEEEGGGLDLLR
jgi:hypothetical protein